MADTKISALTAIPALDGADVLPIVDATDTTTKKVSITQLDGRYATAAQGTTADGAIPKSLVDAKGDLIVATAADTVARLAVGVTDGHVLTVDSAEATGLKWAAASGGSSGQQAIVGTGATRWHTSPYLGVASGTAWPTIGRAYYTPFYFAESVTITAIAINQTVGGTAGNVLRLGLYNASATTKLPTTVIEQGTVSTDASGIKTLTLGTPRTVSGLVWICAGPQGATNPGSAQLSGYYSSGMGPHTSDTGAAWGNVTTLALSLFTDTNTTFADNPALTFEQQNRNPFVAVRIT